MTHDWERIAASEAFFGVLTAAMFPAMHTGRPWFDYWLFPYPSQRGLWPNFKSPLVWDVFAISTYLTISTTFLYVGLIPDIAVLRDRETNLRIRVGGERGKGGAIGFTGGGLERGFADDGISRRSAAWLVALAVFLVAIPPSINNAIFVPWDLTFGSGMQTLGSLLAVLTVGWCLHRAPER